MQQTAALSEGQTESTRRCTGPRTREGKEKSSQNSTKHGCCSKRLLLPDEDPEQWEALKAGWLQSYAADTPAFLLLVVAAAEAQWQLMRAQNAFDHTQYAIYEEQPDCTLWTEEHHKLYSKFQRYQSAAERSFQRAFQDLERLRQSQFRQEGVAFKQDLDRARFSLRQHKTGHETALIEAKLDLTNSKAIEHARKAAASAAHSARSMKMPSV